MKLSKNIRRHALLPLVAALAASTPAFAAPEQRAIASCEVERSWSETLLSQTHSSFEVAQGQMKVIDALDALISKPKFANGKPIGEQMTADEAVEFGNLQQQMKVGLLASLIEAKRERDIKFLGDLWQMAEQMASPGYRPPTDEKAENFTVLVVMVGLQEMMPRVELEEAALASASSPCTFEHALLRRANRAIKEADTIDGIVPALEEMTHLAERYGENVLEKMTPDERAAFERDIRPPIRAYQRKIQLAENLMRVARLEAVSTLMYRAMRNDQYVSPGEIEASGTTWKQWVSEGKVTPDQDKLSRIINYINEKIPADMVKAQASVTPIDATEAAANAADAAAGTAEALRARRR